MRKGGICKWLGIATVMLVAVEIALRVVLGLGHPLVMRLDPTYGYMPAANQDLHRFFSHIRINGFGMRSNDIVRNKPKGVQRILFDGDSVTFGTTYADQDRIFTSRIQKDLSSRNTEVLNASAGGRAPANELGFLQAQGTFGADLVVLGKPLTNGVREGIARETRSW